MLKERTSPLAQRIEEAMLRKTVADGGVPFRQHQFAEKLGVTDAFVSKILAGKVFPGPETLTRMELVLALPEGSLQELAEAERQVQREEKHARWRELAQTTLTQRERRGSVEEESPSPPVVLAPSDPNALLLQVMQTQQAMLEQMQKLQKTNEELMARLEVKNKE